MEITMKKLYLRNRLPQNVTGDTSARFVARDIIFHDIPEYKDLNIVEKKIVKNILVSSLLQMQNENPEKERTLSNLRHSICIVTGDTGDCIRVNLPELLRGAREDAIRDMRYIIFDDLVKYEDFQKLYDTVLTEDDIFPSIEELF